MCKDKRRCLIENKVIKFFKDTRLYKLMKKIEHFALIFI